MSTKKQIEEQKKRKEKRTKEFLTPDWNGEEANDYFTDNYDLHPEEKYWGKPNTEPFTDLRQSYYAKNDIYGEVCESAYIKQNLIDKLKSIISEDATICSKTKSEKYCESRKSIAENILSNIMDNVYAFQKHE